MIVISPSNQSLDMEEYIAVVEADNKSESVSELFSGDSREAPLAASTPSADPHGWLFWF